MCFRHTHAHEPSVPALHQHPYLPALFAAQVSQAVRDLLHNLGTSRSRAHHWQGTSMALHELYLCASCDRVLTYGVARLELTASLPTFASPWALSMERLRSSGCNASGGIPLCLQ